VLRSALFVDFDNIYIRLQEVDTSAARIFAENPAEWLKWLTDWEDDEGPLRRRFLILNCYLNPATDGGGTAGPIFMSSGIRVVNCPSLTVRGKSASDIHLVLDALDALANQVRYDEFVVLSADADFTPLMRRIRADDRRTLMVAGGPTAPAYRAVCDQYVDSVAFIEALQGPILASAFRSRPSDAAASLEVAVEVATQPEVVSPDDDGGAGLARDGDSEADAIAARDAIRRVVAESSSPISGSAAANAASSAVSDIARGGWAGAGRFSPFLAQWAPELVVYLNPAGTAYVADPARHELPTEGGDELLARVSQVTGVPDLTRAQYAVLFDALADELAVPMPQFSPGSVVRGVRDRCRSAEVPVSKAAISSVVEGLTPFIAERSEPPTSYDLASAWKDHVLRMAAKALVRLGPDDLGAIGVWLTGRRDAA